MQSLRAVITTCASNQCQRPESPPREGTTLRAALQMAHVCILVRRLSCQCPSHLTTAHVKFVTCGPWRRALAQLAGLRPLGTGRRMEPRALINPGNLCFMNATLQVPAC